MRNESLVWRTMLRKMWLWSKSTGLETARFGQVSKTPLINCVTSPWVLFVHLQLQRTLIQHQYNQIQQKQGVGVRISQAIQLRAKWGACRTEDPWNVWRRHKENKERQRYRAQEKLL